MDQAIILALVVVLSIKYILYDSKIENIIPAEDIAEPTKGAPVQKGKFLGRHAWVILVKYSHISFSLSSLSDGKE